MYFEKRGYRPVAVASQAELAEKLTQHSWTGCTAFAWAGYIFLQDGSPGGVQEWAIIWNGHQVESVTFGWMTEEEALAYLTDRIRALQLNPPMKKKVTILPHPQGPCVCCA